MGWGSDHATLLHLAESKELSIKLFNARNEMTKPTRKTVTFGETWASPLTAVTAFVLPYICLPRCIRIGVVESIHVPTLGRQFSCGIQTITQGAPEITCITRWLTDQNIYNRSKGDIKWHKTAGCINFLAGMQFLNMISVASFIILLPHPSIEMQTWMVSQAAGEASTVTCQCQLVSHMAASLDQMEINGTYEVKSKHPSLQTWH